LINANPSNLFYHVFIIQRIQITTLKADTSQASQSTQPHVFALAQLCFIMRDYEGLRQK
jgi:hypothetical protein